MTTTNWSNQTADWTTAADWSPSVPNPLIDAVIGFVGTYTVTLDTLAQANSLTLSAGPNAAFDETAAGSLAARGGLTVSSGEAILDGENAFGSVTLNGGTLVAGSANCFGFASLALNGGLLTNDANVALQNELVISGSLTIAAAHGTTLAVGGPLGYSIGLNSGGRSVSFGSAVQDGTVIWMTGSLGGYINFAEADLSTSVDVNAGILQGGDAGFEQLFNSPDNEVDVATNVASGAMIDLAGFNTAVNFLAGSGAVTSATSATLTLTGSSFSGAITGAISLSVQAGCLLSGANSYTGVTTIGGHGRLTIGIGGTTGSLSASSSIEDDGILGLDRSNTVVLGSSISGSGELLKNGTGIAILTQANTLSGLVDIAQGTLQANSATAIGAAFLEVHDGARFLAHANVALPAALLLGASVLEAAASDTLTTSSTTPWDITATSGTITFGAGANSGTVVWNTPTGFMFSGGHVALAIAAGTLRAGDDNFDQLTNGLINGVVTQTTIGAHGILDAAGHPVSFNNLKGSGILENTGAATSLNIAGASFSGKFNGAFGINVSGAVNFSGGLGVFTGPITVFSGSTLTLSGASPHSYILNPNSGSATTTVVLDGFAKQTGAFHGFGAGDTFDLRGVAVAAASESFAFDATPSNGGKLAVTDGTHKETLTLAGDYTGATFALADDGHGGTDVTLASTAAAIHQHFISAMAGLADAVAGVSAAAPIGTPSAAVGAWFAPTASGRA